MKLSVRPALPSPSLVFTALALALFGFGCSDSGGDTDGGPRQAQVVADYATLVEASYAASLAEAKALHEAVHELVENPSEETLDAAKDAWLKSRDPYGETEAFRFYQGPIDNDIGDDDVADGPEGFINSWPIDESYIDYVSDEEGNVVEGVNIINSTTEIPEITEEVLLDLNTKQGEDSISTGYHAIEFLLWGQDHDDNGPGARPYTDYDTSEKGTGGNQARRGQYLVIAADLLVAQLQEVHDAWKEGDDTYRAKFLGLPPAEAIGAMMLGMGSLSGAELSGERMSVAYDNRDQEDEHSCFSDNTLADLRNNALSVQNVLLGRYADLDGAGIDELVEAKDAELADTLRAQIQDAIDAIKDIPAPFDQAIQGDDDSEGRKAVITAVRALQDFTKSLEAAAKVLDVELALETE
jgi:putative iron-regulated protein